MFRKVWFGRGHVWSGKGKIWFGKTRRRAPIGLLLCCATLASGGPVDFGLAELNAAIAARKQRWKPKAELSLEPPETYRIEPYKAGGAHITGGDLRGLMYGLLEAADQVRTTGRLTQAHGAPSTPLREVRLVVEDGDAGQFWYSSADSWRTYFQMLARNRFNRFTLVFTHPSQDLASPYRLLELLSRTAAEYGIDFALGIGGDNVLLPDTHDSLRDLLAACKMIRNVQVGNTTQAEAVFQAVREAGRRVTVDLRGSHLAAALIKSAEDPAVPLLRPAVPWPPSFEVAPPRTEGRLEAEGHPLFYWAWGRFGYDPKTKPPKGADLDEYRAASDVVRDLAMAQEAASEDISGEAKTDEWGFIASISEAVHNRLLHVASAKQTPLETADLVEAAAARLDKAVMPDFQLLANLARERARELRAAYQAEWSRQRAETSGPGQRASADPASSGGESVPAPVASSVALSGPKPLPRPQFSHTPPETATANEPLTLTVGLTPHQDVAAVRLHYRPLHPLGELKTIEQPPAASLSFTIPASDLPVNLDLLYYFEILNREEGGWFEPDPLITTPYYMLKIPAAPPMQ